MTRARLAGALMAAGLVLMAGFAPDAMAIPVIDLPTDQPQEVTSGGERVSFRSGMEATEKGDFVRAKSIFNAFLEANPKAPGAYLGLTEVAVRMKDLAGAEKILAQGIQASPKVSEFYSTQARLLKIRKNYAGADQQYAKAISLAPNKLKLRVEYADFLATERNQPQKALPHYNLALSKNPQSAEAQFGLAFAYSQLNREKDSIGALDKAQRLAPKNPMPSYTLARIHLRAGRNKEALAAIDRSLKIAPQGLNAHLTRAEILLGLGRYDQAASAYNAALQIDKSSQPAVIGIGMSYQLMRNYSQAETYYRRAIAKDPRQAFVLNNLAWMAAERKTNLPEAVDWAQRATKIFPAQANFRDTLGWVYYQKGDYRAAKSEFLAALKIHPDAATYTHLGAANAALGLQGEAKDSYRQALKLEPAFKPALSGLQGVK